MSCISSAFFAALLKLLTLSSLVRRYIVKSCTSQETKCLLRILVPYADYVVNNKGSFLTRFLGLHSIKMYGKDYSFVVMSNIFNTNKVINQSYDIKGR